VFGTNTKFKEVSPQFVRVICLEGRGGVGEREGGSPQDSEASIRTFREIGFGFVTDNRRAIVCMSHFYPLESQSEKHKVLECRSVERFTVRKSREIHAADVMNGRGKESARSTQLGARTSFVPAPRKL
jgi:hypothetical protein